MVRRFVFTLLALVVISGSGVAQEEDTTETKRVPKFEGPEPLEFVFRPQLSMGVGMFTFYGDIANNHSGFHPTVSRVGYDMRVINPLTDYLDMGFYVLFGQVSAGERTLDRNLNFNAHITTGGLTLNYNFKQLLNPDRLVDPYVSVGIESMEFLAKTDYYDANGNVYHYWSDGTIRDMAEDDPGASAANEIFRDYVYESDVRELNLDGFGKYQERTWAVPVEVGANMHLGKRVKFRVGTSMHFAFTDLVDGVTSESLGNRKGDDKNDKFLYTHFALTYDLIYKKYNPLDDIFDPDRFEDYRRDTMDSDGDLVVDLADLCANTPENGRPVDEFGCPLDGDNDGVGDYMDEELDTPEGTPVHPNGVGYTDEDYLLAYRIYMDSIGEFADLQDVHRVTQGEGSSGVADQEGIAKGKSYGVVIGREVTGVTANDLHAYLSNKDFHIVEQGDTVLFVIGNYSNPEDALALAEELKLEGYGDLSIVEESNAGSGVREVPKDEIGDGGNSGGFKKGETIYRIQIGAFRNRLSKSVFGDAEDLIWIEGDDGLFRYYSGEFTSKQAAANHRIKMMTNGYDGSFIVVFKDGDRLKLEDGGFEVTPGHVDTNVESSEPSESAVRSELISFHVQVGAYANDIPTEMLDIYLAVGNVKPVHDNASGLTKYFIGDFEDYDEADEFRKELEREGLIDSFVVGDFNGKIISAQEALELLNQ